MKRNRKSKNAKAVFPLSAMIDVVFLLLLFFIATFVPHKQESHMSAGQASPSGTPSRGATLDVRILPEGYEVMGRPRTLAQVEIELVRKVQGDPEMPVLLKVSPSAMEGQVVALMDVCGKIGLQKLLILTLKE